jgi:hypothetical protein
MPLSDRAVPFSAPTQRMYPTASAVTRDASREKTPVRAVESPVTTATFEPVIPRGVTPLTAGQRTALVAEILGSYCAARWALRRNDLRGALIQLRSVAAGSSTSAPAWSDGHLAASRLGYIVGRTLPLLPTDSRCLMRSLVLVRLLARRGVACSLVLGVTTSPKVRAHAWVEHAGKPVLPAYETVFTRLTEL